MPSCICLPAGGMDLVVVVKKTAPASGLNWLPSGLRGWDPGHWMMTDGSVVRGEAGTSIARAAMAGWRVVAQVALLAG